MQDLMQVGCAMQHQLAPDDDDIVTSWVVSCDTLANVRSLRSAEEESQLGMGQCATNIAITNNCFLVANIE